MAANSKKRVRSRNHPTIFGTGLIALDLVISTESESIHAWAGGTCGNVLTILSFLGWDSYPIARLNGDAASRKVKADFRKWGVHLDYATCEPTCDTPIIVQEIKRDRSGSPKHRFSWACPHCGNWLPPFKPVTTHEIDRICEKMVSPRVFFMDRLSRSSLTLASAAAKKGALVVFELSARPDSQMLEEVLDIAHVIKYADQRFQGFKKQNRPGSATLLEIQTLGDKGLRYRSWIPTARTKGWKRLAGLSAPHLADTCGAGDWCSAGIISKLGTGGLKGLSEFTGAKLEKAMMYGQALAAWNCGFQGARGGMNSNTKKTVEQQVQNIITGEQEKTESVLETKTRPFKLISCPACSTSHFGRGIKKPEASHSIS